VGLVSARIELTMDCAGVGEGRYRIESVWIQMKGYGANLIGKANAVSD